MARNTPVPMRVLSGAHDKVAAATPAAGEVLFDTGENTLVVGDGATVGGHPMATRAYVVSEIAGTPWFKAVNGPMPEDVSELVIDMPIGGLILAEE